MAASRYLLKNGYTNAHRDTTASTDNRNSSVSTLGGDRTRFPIPMHTSQNITTPVHLAANEMAFRCAVLFAGLPI